MDINRLDDLMSEYEARVSVEIAGYFYQMADISVRVSPNAFLSTVVKENKASLKLEDVCKVYQTDEYSVAIVPNRTKHIISIIKALKLTHPEYKLEESTYKDELTGADNRYLICRMADVNDDQYDIYVDVINTKHDEVSTRLRELTQNLKLLVAKQLEGASAELVKAYEDRISQTEDSCYKSCDTTRDKKLAEVDKGHQEYLEKTAQKQQEQEQKQQSRDASLSMDM